MIASADSELKSQIAQFIVHIVEQIDAVKTRRVLEHERLENKTP